MKNIDLSSFNLSNRQDRYRARKAGLDVPKLQPGRPTKPFWEQVEKTNTCWVWLGTKNIDGYGEYNIAGKTKMAHRHAYEMHTGLQIGSKIAMHSCDNPACVNPKHITIGTHADNQRDKTNKNRQAKGESVGTSVLTESQVLSARARYKFRVCTYKMLADEFGCSKDTMQKAIRGINWKHI